MEFSIVIVTNELEFPCFAKKNDRVEIRTSPFMESYETVF
jgi:hypothetical protein